MKNFISLRLPSLFFLLAGVWMLIPNQVQAQNTTVTLSPTKDTYLHGGATTTNYGGCTTFEISRYYNRRALLQFDLTSIPADATIVSATLKLTQTASSSTTGTDNIEARMLTNSWTEGSGACTGVSNTVANWNQRVTGQNWATVGGGGDYNSTVYATTSVGTAPGDYTWNLLTMVNAWRSGTTNNGILLKFASEETTYSRSHTFASREHATSAYRPTLTIVYNCTSTPIFTVDSTSTRCQGKETVTYTATPKDGKAITYSMDLNSLWAGNTIDPATGEVTFAANFSGTTTITATSSGGCSATHVVTTKPAVFTPEFDLENQSFRCVGAGTVTYKATAYNAVSTTYSLDEASLKAGNTIDVSTGTVTYVANWMGTSTITATATGCGGMTKTATHTAHSKNTLTAVDDFGEGQQGAPIKVNVLANDVCGYDVSKLKIVTPPQNGEATLGSNGEVTYQPSASFFGVDYLTYEICNADGTQCSQADVKFTVEQDIFSACISASRAKTYYLSFPENKDQLRKSLWSAGNVSYLTDNVRTVISIKVAYPGTVIVYDHWEDGYEADITDPVQWTTQVWGDGDPSNGTAPGYPDDIIPPGGFIVLDNQFKYNDRDRNVFTYDGKDKLRANAEITISKVTGDAGMSGNTPMFTVQNIKTSVYDTDHFGKKFILPLGENVTYKERTTPVSAFKYTGLFVRAMMDGTVVNLDYNGDGTVDITKNLNEGEVYFYDGKASTPGRDPGDVNQANDIKAGAVVTANHPVGVDLLFGGIDSYGTRNISVLPDKFYGNTYYSPIYTTNTSAPVYVFFTNPSNEPITINWTAGTTLEQTGSVTVPGKGYGYVSLEHKAAYKFQSSNGEIFTAIGVVDADESGSAYDWAFKLIPESQLTNYASVAWAPGSYDLSGNYNPLWVTSPSATTLYVKFDGDLTEVTPNMSPCGLPYDMAIPLEALQSYQVYNPNKNDQSGTALYTCADPIAVIWGQDAGKARESFPGLDVGYALTPGCLKAMVIANDDYRVTDPGTPIEINVLENDAAFLCSIDPTTLRTDGLLQPENGTISITADNNILYTPNPDFLGKDKFEYNLCSKEYPDICATATVIVNVVPCSALDNQNVIKGNVFVDQSPFDNVYTNEKGATGVRVNLYSDNNCDGTINETDRIVQQTVSDPSGNFSFITHNGHYVKDDFESKNYSGNVGSVNWNSNWTENGDDNDLTTGNVQIAKDPVSDSYAVRLSGPSKGISRSVQFTKATSAMLKFSFRRQNVAANRSMLVLLNGQTVYQTTTGVTQTDAQYTDIMIPLEAEKILGNDINTLQFITDGSTTASETYWVDNVELFYYGNSSCFIVAAEPSKGCAYTVDGIAEDNRTKSVMFDGIGNCTQRVYLPVRALMVAADDKVSTATDIPVKIEILDNDLQGRPNPSSVTITTDPESGTVTINPDGSVIYTPNKGFNGTDTFIYQVCSMDDPSVCSTAVVTVNVSCASTPGKNTITGLVFNDVNKNGIYETNESGKSGIKVNLFLDANGNGVLDTDETKPIETATTNAQGAYSFAVTPQVNSYTYLDRFEYDGFRNLSNGTADWSTSQWNEIGSMNVSGSFLWKPVTITSVDGLAIMPEDNNTTGTQYGAYRSANLEGAVAAKLSFKFTKASTMAENPQCYVDVYVADSPSPTSWTRLTRISGGDTSIKTSTLSFDITPYISAGTTIRFVTAPNAVMKSTDIVYFDDVQIEFGIPKKTDYIIQLAQPVPDGYIVTTPTPDPTGIQTASFTEAGVGICEKNFGLKYNNFWMGSASSTDWGTATNWTATVIPKPGEDVIFATEANNDGVKAVNDLQLDQDRVIGSLINETELATIVPAGKSLTVQGKVVGSETNPDKLHVKAGDPKAADEQGKANGTLIVATGCDQPIKGTVEFLAQGIESEVGSWTDDFAGSPDKDSVFVTKYKWQHFGIPVKEITHAIDYFENAYVREYDEAYNGDNKHFYQKWHNLSTWSKLEAFKGYEITHDKADLEPNTTKLYKFAGDLNFCDQSLTLTRLAPLVEGASGVNEHYGLGQNIFGNSYTSAIKISAMKFPADNTVEKTVYLYNTGRFHDWATTGKIVTGTTPALQAGNYLSIPQKVGNTIWNDQIPSMQGFLLKFTPEESTTAKYKEPSRTVTLPYSTTALTANTKPQLAPSRVKGGGVENNNQYAGEQSDLVYLRVNLQSKSTVDNLWLFSQEGTTEQFDNGWDGRKNFGTPTAFIYTETPDGPMQVNTNSTIDATPISFYGNGDGSYTLTLVKTNLENYLNLHLIDFAAKSVTPLIDDTTRYTFTSAVKGSVEKRFMIVNKPASQIDLANGSFDLLDGYITPDNVLTAINYTSVKGKMLLYSASGSLMLSKEMGTGTNQYRESLQPGAYIMRLEAKNSQKSIKLIVK